MRALILALGLIAAPAMAQDTVGAWTIEEVDNGCTAVTTYYGRSLPTRLALGETIDGRSIMILQNTGWSTEDGKSYDVYLMVDEDFFTGKATGSSGGSLIFNLKPEVMKSITKGTRMVPALKIDDNNEKLLEQMKLTGSAAAMGRVQTCLTRVRQKSAALSASPRTRSSPN